jgi:hypothetical protein
MIRNFLVGEIVEIKYKGKVETAQIWDIKGVCYSNSFIHNRMFAN